MRLALLLLLIPRTLTMPFPPWSAEIVVEAPRSPVGVASWYGQAFAHRLTASGARYLPDALTAAHRTLPFGTYITVRSLSTDREVTVQITDRGPFIAGRDLDLSRGAAKRLGMLKEGVIEVRYTIL